MAHTETWNTAYEADPDDSTDDVGDGAGEIRDFKRNIRERMAIDHYMDIAGTDADHGEHSKITFQAQYAPGSPGADKAFLYTKDANSKAELHYKDEDDNEIQVTSGGRAATPFADVPAGEIILFEKDTAVTGYTLQVDEDDKLVFISKGSVAGGETGGGDHSTGTWTLPSGDHAHMWCNLGTHGFEGDGVTTQGLNQNSAVGGGLIVRDDSGLVEHTQNSQYTNLGNLDLGATWRPAARVFTRQARD